MVRQSAMSLPGVGAGVGVAVGSLTAGAAPWHPALVASSGCPHVGWDVDWDRATTVGLSEMGWFLLPEGCLVVRPLAGFVVASADAAASVVVRDAPPVLNDASFRTTMLTVVVEGAD